MTLVNADYIPVLVGHSKDDPFTWEQVRTIMKWVEAETRKETKQRIAEKLTALIVEG